MKLRKVIDIINIICREKKYNPIEDNSSEIFKLKLRDDLGFDSFDLAVLTVHVEEEFGVDVFEDGLIETIGEIYEKISNE